MARSADHALLRAVKKRDSYGRTLSEQRLMVEDAARAANMLTGRSISVSGGYGGLSAPDSACRDLLIILQTGAGGCVTLQRKLAYRLSGRGRCT